MSGPLGMNCTEMGGRRPILTYYFLHPNGAGILIGETSFAEKKTPAFG